MCGIKEVLYMPNDARKDYIKGGWRFVECKLCGKRFNAGRPQNYAGIRWAQGLKDSWWAHHTETLNPGVLEICKEDISETCAQVGK
jgi:hypothetical protein